MEIRRKETKADTANSQPYLVGEYDYSRYSCCCIAKVDKESEDPSTYSDLDSDVNQEEETYNPR